MIRIKNRIYLPAESVESGVAMVEGWLDSEVMLDEVASFEVT